MKDTVIYSDPLLGEFTVQDLIYFLQDILKEFDNKTVLNLSNKNINQRIKFIIDILNENV